MILYTPIPLEQVLEGHDNPLDNLQEITIEGKQVLVESVGNGEGRVVRLFSTDPADYLDGRFNPGRRVVFSGNLVKENNLL